VFPSFFGSDSVNSPEQKTAVLVAVEFDIMQQARMTLAKSPPGTTLDLITANIIRYSKEMPSPSQVGEHMNKEDVKQAPASVGG